MVVTTMTSITITVIDTIMANISTKTETFVRQIYLISEISSYGQFR